MSISMWLRTPRVRRGLAAGALVLATGGCILFRARSDAHVAIPTGPTESITGALLATAVNGGAFSGGGAHGALALSHTKVLAGQDRQVFAVLTMSADAVDKAAAHAPLAMAVVLDTSGSMEGDKMQQAKESVVRMIRDMRDEDEIAVVRYSDDSEVVQSLARVGTMRESLIGRVRALRAGGGTAIPRGLKSGMKALADAERGRVRRVVLVSDGLDSTRAEAERLASDGFEHGVVVSSLGIGLDFDEGYMSSVSRFGHGNFAFVEDGNAIAKFLKRELDETAATTIENATAKLTLPKGVRFVRALGADATPRGDDVELKMGSLFAGDERRVVVELSVGMDVADARAITGTVAWQRLGVGGAEASLPALTLVASNDESAVQAGLDGTVLASATSVLASARQLEAAAAYTKGDTARAKSLMQQNQHDLSAAAKVAPAPAATALDTQMKEYAGSAATMATSSPTSDTWKRAAKGGAQKDNDNMNRKSY
jgi:Ca-activated chloride channel family protein